MAHRPPPGSTRCTAESEAFQLAVADALAVREIQDGVAEAQIVVTEIQVAAAVAEPVAEPLAQSVAGLQIAIAGLSSTFAENTDAPAEPAAGSSQRGSAGALPRGRPRGGGGGLSLPT